MLLRRAADRRLVVPLPTGGGLPSSSDVALFGSFAVGWGAVVGEAEAATDVAPAADASVIGVGVSLVGDSDIFFGGVMYSG